MSHSDTRNRDEMAVDDVRAPGAPEQRADLVGLVGREGRDSASAQEATKLDLAR
jgi:hypothetical protein